MTIKVGQTFSIGIGQEIDGRLDFPVPEPTSHAISLLSRSGAFVMYQARVAGVTTLVAHRSIFCDGGQEGPRGPVERDCVALRVRVLPR